LYTVETKPGYGVEEVLIPVQNAIFADVASNVGGDFSGSISAKPMDEINGKLVMFLLLIDEYYTRL
jgi:hypothetical protein